MESLFNSGFCIGFGGGIGGGSGLTMPAAKSAQVRCGAGPAVENLKSVFCCFCSCFGDTMPRKERTACSWRLPADFASPITPCESSVLVSGELADGENNDAAGSEAHGPRLTSSVSL